MMPKSVKRMWGPIMTDPMNRTRFTSLRRRGATHPIRTDGPTMWPIAMARMRRGHDF